MKRFSGVVSVQLKGAQALSRDTVHNDLAAPGEFLIYRQIYNGHSPVTEGIPTGMAID